MKTVSDGNRWRKILSDCSTAAREKPMFAIPWRAKRFGCSSQPIHRSKRRSRYRIPSQSCSYGGRVWHRGLSLNGTLCRARLWCVPGMFIMLSRVSSGTLRIQPENALERLSIPSSRWRRHIWFRLEVPTQYDVSYATAARHCQKKLFLPICQIRADP